MTSVLFMSACLASVCLSWAASTEYQQKVSSSLKECGKQYNVDMKEVLDIVRSNKLPETNDQKCVAGCFLTKMGYVTDLTLDWGKLKAANPQKYETPELVEKANQVADTCAKVVTEKAANACELGVPVMSCIYEEAGKIQLPKPDFKIEE